MIEEGAFPDYIVRVAEQKQILDELEKVRKERRSRAVLLYGRGGVGKTSLVRGLAKAQSSDQATVWVEPVDIDDSVYWLISNLEQHVADALDPGNRYFRRYREHLLRLPAYTRPRVGYETVVSHLARIKRVFAECYQEFITDSGKTVVMTLDTVEAIRGMYVLQTVTQWMKALPATLFILAGRPPAVRDAAAPDVAADPLYRELTDPHQPLPVEIVQLGDFTWDAALDYLKASGLASSGPAGASGLSQDELAKVVHLTHGHPLWLAFAVDYLRNSGLPEEAEIGLTELAAEVPFQGKPTPSGTMRYEKFKADLVAPYQDTDFWHEALRRLAVVRESINQPVWEEFMADRPPPDDMSTMGADDVSTMDADDASTMDAAWDRLLKMPWIRTRANRRYVTLHDAVAEEFSLGLIPMHDRHRQWRRGLWERARGIYVRRSEELEAELGGDLAQVRDELHSLVGRRGGAQPPSAAEESDLIEEAAQLEVRRRELLQIKATRLYYELLCNPAGGCRLFLDFMEEARAVHDILFQNLLAAEIQRFLPMEGDDWAPGDAVGEIIGEFRDWLDSPDGREIRLEVGLSLADYLIRAEQPVQALELTAGLPDQNAVPLQRYRLSNLRGNACMRIPGRFHDAEAHFSEALIEAGGVQSDDRLRTVAQAHKELGFYHRNGGKLRAADDCYQRARDAISETLQAGATDEDREEMASIQTNWAYVKGLTGAYRDGSNLVQSAITVRRRLGLQQEQGISWSVLGEVYRYERRFHMAWEAYAEADRIFQVRRNWGWLGFVYQEQAVCLFQAVQDRIELLPDPLERAKRLITIALDLCRDLAVRGYPSALNRAGRIYGAEDVDEGLKYLAEGIEEARRLSDGWFWFANLIQFAELSYRAWVGKEDESYLERMQDREPEIAAAMDEYDFPDLKGRWDLVRGHVLVRRALAARNEDGLDRALEFYKTGFVLMSRDYVGSSGAAAVAGEFKRLGVLVRPLPKTVRERWQTELRRAWTEQKSSATILLAGLEELY
jgi:tetratricopeptide (TPR) repeat protein